ncbi:GNAT family N-acetyltransferase [Rothia nasisuis]|uniref:GNAT family N-acetyltransferase n=1 Tax=Rothia nasisuis TaxID=2109647 RepID=UPI001F3F75E4|nr:GNAT family N-acetyltransferase [Rothia nasisuis]
MSYRFMLVSMTAEQFLPDAIAIRPIDITSDSDMEQLNTLDSACHEKLYGFPSTTTVEERRAILAPSSYHENHRWVAEVQGQILGIVLVSLPLKENLDGLTFLLAVHPDAEGRGLEEALTRHALAAAIEPSGRTHITYYGNLMQGESKDAPALPINRVAALLGLEPKNSAITRIAPLPLPASLVQAADHKKMTDSTYTFEVWDQEIPEQYLESAATAYHQLEVDEPTGEAYQEAADFTPERLREIEAKTRAAGEGIIYAAALSQGKVVALTALTYPVHPGNVSAWQESTVVMPEHRGRGLSRTLKVLSHTRLPVSAPHIQQIITMNSAVNPAMIKVNEELGYRPVWEEICYQN